MISLPYILLTALPILTALTFHEYSHAYVANRLGDPTAKSLGRLSLNPLVHLDIVGTLMVLYLRFGWAKPVPVNPLNFKNPRKDLLWVSLAGPGSNLLLAFIFGMLCRSLNITTLKITDFSPLSIIHFMIAYGMIINLMLAFFNILPIPPLDGSKIIAGILPQSFEHAFSRFLKYGHFLLLGLIVLSVAFNIPVFSFLHFFVRMFSYVFAGTSFI